MSSSTKKKNKNAAEAIMICLDTSKWMESTKSVMFQDQVKAIKLYCDIKFKSNPKTVVGVCGMARYSLRKLIRPTRSIERIVNAINDATIGGYLSLSEASSVAHYYGFGPEDTVMPKRLVFFAGGPMCYYLEDAERLGLRMQTRNFACDAINFGYMYSRKREFFDIFINTADNNGNCNLCHVPPESSVFEALSRSQIIIPRSSPPPVGGRGSSLAPLSAHKEETAVLICVKQPHSAADANKTDCPFCQRVLLTLLEKKLPYETYSINLDNKPEWFVAANPDGILPLVKFKDDDKWYSNSDVIVEMIEKKHPRTPLVSKAHFGYLGLKILPKLLAYLKHSNDGTRKALLAELKELENHLSEYGGPYVNGDNITAVDLSLAPKLYHLVVACECFKQWNITEGFPKVLDYTELLFKCTSFKETEPVKGDILNKWNQKLEVDA